MDHHHWAHPYDSQGQRLDFAAIPNGVEKLRDDPYRSLAAEVRRHGGFSKDLTPFAEFLWADFFRRRIPLGRMKPPFRKVLLSALDLAHSPSAQHLPGWAGNHS